MIEVRYYLTWLKNQTPGDELSDVILQTLPVLALCRFIGAKPSSFKE